MAGFRLVPVAHWDGEQSIRWEWRTSSGELLARTRCFTPTEAYHLNEYDMEDDSGT